MKELKTAYPTSFYNKTTGETICHDEGMSLRDYFASLALTSIMTSENFSYEKTPEDMAKASYVIADSMLKQREL